MARRMIRTPAFWQRRGLASTALLPFSLCYAFGFAFDRCMTPTQKAPLPVISIGNLTTGGAGKTPTVIALAALLRDMGEVPHILSRGYGGKAWTARQVTAQDSAADVGDEALLLAAAAPTWVGARRIASARAAHAAGATVLLADDALQHHGLHRDLSIIVVDTAYGFGNGRLLPAGPLRQTPASAYADITPTATLLLGDQPPPRGIVGDCWHGAIAPSQDTAWLHEGAWLAFAGIAHPQKFYATLQSCGADLQQTHDFADHHPFSHAEIEELLRDAASKGLKLITTEKDAVRLPAEIRAQIATLPVQLQFQQPEIVKAWLRQWHRSST